MNRKPTLIQDDVVTPSDNIDELVEEISAVADYRAEMKAAREQAVKLAKKRLAAIFR